MQIREYRDDDFVDREKEIEYLKGWFSNTPKEILWLFGPKSTGKTTLIEYVIERELFSNFLKFESIYNIKYINFRRKAIGSFDNFIDALLEEKSSDDEIESELNRAYNLLGVFKLEAKTLKRYKEKKKDLFESLLAEFRKSKKRNILIIDEIQTLEDIYMNGGKLLLKEFLNFCVALTKETHLCHVVILSSNTIFLDRIYNDAKLKVTSEFKKIDHLDKDTTLEYLRYKAKEEKIKLTEDELELIWDYLGGCIPLLQRLFRKVKYFNSLQEYLESEAELAVSEVEILFRWLIKKEKGYMIEPFKKIAKEIVEKGFTKQDKTKEIIDTIDFFSEKEILFYDPLTREVKGNNRLYEKGFERLS